VEVIVGTRQSELALWQAEWVAQRLRRCNPDVVFRIKGIKTRGDHILDVALAKIGDKGLFTKELEYALLEGGIDLAVHSMKDLPSELPDGLVIGAVCEREHPGDVLISKKGETLAELPPGAVVGTSSLRRIAHLLRYRPDLRPVTVRGNVNTRLRKLFEGGTGGMLPDNGLDAIVLAFAGVRRMGWEERISQLIPFSICLPAVGQGSIGIEIRGGDQLIAGLAAQLDHPESRAAVAAERAFLKRLEGGCQVPVGALGEVQDGRLTLEGAVSDLTGSRYLRSSLTGGPEEAEELGTALAGKLIAMGAGEILKEIRSAASLRG
jgi:hydroxymethylbilane synthase